MAAKFDPQRHPRDKRGRFTKSRTVLASAKDKQAVKEITGGFKPAKTGDGKAYAGKIADPRQHSVARDFALDAKAINEDLRAGHADAAGVKPMDDAMRPLPEDLILHRSVPASAFGGIDPASLQGMKVRDAGFSATQLDAPQPSDGVHMLIAAPKGSRAVVNGDTGEVYLDRDSEMVVSHVEPNPAGGHDMYLTVLPKAPAKDDGKTPKAEPADPTHPSSKPEPGKRTETDKPQGAGDFRAGLMKQKVPELQAQMRERGLKPGKKRKSELVDALVADETGHDGKGGGKPATDTTPVADTPKPKAPASPADRVHQAITDLFKAGGSKKSELISLARVRDRLGGVDRADVDKALLALDRDRVIQLEPEVNRQAITDRARAAAVHLGGEDMHLVALLKPASGGASGPGSATDRLDELAAEANADVAGFKARSAETPKSPVDLHLQQIGTAQGFGATPQVGTRAEVDAAVAAGWTETWRGVMPSASGVTPAQINEQLRTGAYGPGRGYYGNGYYVAERRLTAENFRGSEPLTNEPAGGGADFDLSDLDPVDEPDSLLRIAIDPAAKTADFDELAAEMKQWIASQSAGSPSAVVFADVGRYAAARGIDVISVSGDHPDGGYYPGWEEAFDELSGAAQYVVLNRAVMLIQRAEDAP